MYSFIHGGSLSLIVINLLGMEFEKIFIVWLKIATCSCTFLCEKREFQFTSSIAFLIASLIFGLVMAIFI